jgi:membrane protein
LLEWDPMSDASPHGESPVRSPLELSFRDWKELLRRVRKAHDDDHQRVAAAGMAFFMALSVPPLAALLFSIYGLVTDPKLVEEQMRMLGDLIPSPAWRVVGQHLSQLTSQPPSVLGVGFLVGLGGLVAAVSSGALMMIRSMNIAYRAQETRGFLALRWLALKLTLGILAFGAIALALVAILPFVLNVMRVEGDRQMIARAARWPIMVATAMVSLAVVYRITPNRERPQWRWVSAGSLVATVVWLLGSALFSVYVDVAAKYDRVYGSVAGIAVFMLWLYMSAQAMLLGAALNAEMERQALPWEPAPSERRRTPVESWLFKSVAALRRRLGSTLQRSQP